MATIQVKGKTVSTVTVEDNTKSLNRKADVPLLLSFPHSGEHYPDDFKTNPCLLYTSPSPRELSTSRMPSSD